MVAAKRKWTHAHGKVARRRRAEVTLRLTASMKLWCARGFLNEARPWKLLLKRHFYLSGQYISVSVLGKQNIINEAIEVLCASFYFIMSSNLGVHRMARREKWHAGLAGANFSFISLSSLSN